MGYPLEILYEDNHILVVNKPAGLLSQGDVTGDQTILDFSREYIKIKYQKPGNVFLHAAHRLDRPTSGILIMAKTSKAQSRLGVMFKNREIQKMYIALCRGYLAETSGKLTHYLKKDTKQNKVFVQKDERGGGKLSMLKYETIGIQAGVSVIKIILLTGRSHQIRAQLNIFGSPLLGDLKYGSGPPLPDRSIGLHAYKVRFLHPVGKATVELTAPLPKSLHWDSARQFVDDICF